MADGSAGGGVSPYVHRIRVRYGEVDMQQVVFNSHYMAYCDDAVEMWLRHLGLRVLDHGWDFMLKKAVMEWDGAASVHETIEISVGLARSGTTSFDVSFHGRVGDRPGGAGEHRHGVAERGELAGEMTAVDALPTAVGIPPIDEERDPQRLTGSGRARARKGRSGGGHEETRMEAGRPERQAAGARALASPGGGALDCTFHDEPLTQRE